MVIWSVTEQPGSIQKGLEVWAFGNQRSFRISVEIIHWGGFERHKGLKIILNQYLTGHDMMAVMVEMVYNLDMSHTTLPQLYLRSGGSANAQTDATFIIVTPA